MSLEKWVEYGWLRRESTSPGEIKDLLGIVERSISDSKVEAVSTDLRFIAAFNAALSVATTALRASGHRTVTQAGHHGYDNSIQTSYRGSPFRKATSGGFWKLQSLFSPPLRATPYAAKIWAPLVTTTLCADAAAENRDMRPSTSVG